MHQRLIWIALAAVLVGALLAWLLTSGVSTNPQPQEVVIIEEVPTPTPAPVQRIVLFFIGSDGLLHPELRETELPEETDARLRVVVRELLAGPQGDLAPVVPWEAEIGAVFLDGDGNAFVDLTPPPEALEGSHNEITLSYGLVNSIILNCPELTAVQVLFGGREIASMTGHLDLSHPLRMNKAFIAAS